MPVSDVCVCQTIRTSAGPQRYILLSNAGQCADLPVSTPKNQLTWGRYAESGNKIPTIVQKFYTMPGKNLHEIANKFFWGQF
jgi:hypothetical protein